MNAPGDFSIGHDDRLLVKIQLRRVIELVAPECCIFYPTFAQRSGVQTPWFLGVPLHEGEPTIKSFKKPLQYCAVCGEPFARNVNLVAEWNPGCYSAYDVSSPAEWQSWKRPTGEMFRMPLISVRLIALLKRLGFRGIDPSGPMPALNASETDWVTQNYEAVTAVGLVAEPAAALNLSERRWFTKWLKTSKNKPPQCELTLKELEQKHGIILPSEYHEFASASGEVRFNKAEDDGLEIVLLAPTKADFTNWRRGKTEMDDPQSREVDGVMIADTNCGDVFCFDLAAKGQNPPVLRYNHELDCYEEYADNFVTCLRRFANVGR
jgi:hypothetical protein